MLVFSPLPPPASSSDFRSGAVEGLRLMASMRDLSCEPPSPTAIVSVGMLSVAVVGRRQVKRWRCKKRTEARKSYLTPKPKLPVRLARQRDSSCFANANQSSPMRCRWPTLHRVRACSMSTMICSEQLNQPPASRLRHFGSRREVDRYAHRAAAQTTGRRVKRGKAEPCITIGRRWRVDLRYSRFRLQAVTVDDTRRVCSVVLCLQGLYRRLDWESFGDVNPESS